ncbi:RNA recognition motif-containing protein [Besnoitia besnoiti]|uniref:RNA recognition motif-containing protein n=1 Tax=Besnoitia besnoiti TaxID=94643 RepID=A0A2A9MG54_BESBE|nr:RNA recognition motif-containing protein [Besnoitia besnoiti]PFH37488.1 RNA recognition motif-containing protein [Besnoitia besnoiti]
MGSAPASSPAASSEGQRKGEPRHRGNKFDKKRAEKHPDRDSRKRFHPDSQGGGKLEKKPKFNRCTELHHKQGPGQQVDKPRLNTPDSQQAADSSSTSRFHQRPQKRREGGGSPARPASAPGEHKKFINNQKMPSARYYAAPKTDEERAEERKRSIFVSNLPPDVTRDELNSIFNAFGPLATTKLVMGGATEDQAGKKEKGMARSAFVIFRDEASAARALAAGAGAPMKRALHAPEQQKKVAGLRGTLPQVGAMSVFAAEALSLSQEAEEEEDAPAVAEQRDLMLRGQTLVVRPVLAREEAQKLKTQGGQWTKKEQSAARRNLQLAFVGMISPKSAAFQELPPPEQRRRLQAWQEKREKMKNPNYFVNPTRLSVRNLPASASANDIREKAAHFLVKSSEFAELQTQRLKVREALQAPCAKEKAGGDEAAQGQARQARVTEFARLHPKQQRRLAEQAILKVRIIRDKERRRASSPYLPAAAQSGAEATEKRSLGFAFVDCADATVAEIVLNFLGSCTSQDFLPEGLSLLDGAKGKQSWRKLMVEYAMEDARKVKIKEDKNRAYVQMLERQKKSEEGKDTEGLPAAGKPLSKKLKTYSRGKRQRERRRQARLAAAGLAADAALLAGHAEGQKCQPAASREASSPPEKEPSKKRIDGKEARAAEEKKPRKEKKKRKKSKEEDRDDASTADDEVLVFDDEGETHKPRVYPKRIKSHPDSRRRRKQANGAEDNESLEEDFLKKRVKSLLSGQA